MFGSRRVKLFLIFGGAAVIHSNMEPQFEELFLLKIPICIDKILVKDLKTSRANKNSRVTSIKVPFDLFSNVELALS